MRKSLQILGINDTATPLPLADVTLPASAFPLDAFRLSDFVDADVVLLHYPGEQLVLQEHAPTSPALIRIERGGSWSVQPRLLSTETSVAIDSKGRIYPTESIPLALASGITIRREQPFSVLREGSYVHHPVIMLESASLMIDHNNATSVTPIVQRLKKVPLISADSVAIINLEAHIAFIKQDWSSCIDLCLRSIQTEPKQHMAYLLLHKAHASTHQWEEAYKALFTMLETGTESNINWDVTLPLAEAHLLLGEVAFRMGWHDRSYLHLDEVYAQDATRLPANLLHRQYIFAVELNDREKGIRYFRHIFEGKLDQTLSDDEWSELDGLLILMLNNDWYDEVLSIIEHLYTFNKTHKSLLRRWISVLIKAGKVTQAQQLLNQHTSIIS